MKTFSFYGMLFSIITIAIFGICDVFAKDFKYTGEMITIPAGSFLMGNSGEPKETFVAGDELPQHSVYLPSYQIGRYEVTRGEYRKFIKDGGYQNKGYWSDEGWEWNHKTSSGVVDILRIEPKYWATVQDWGYGKFTQTDKHPVIGVTYYEAEAFCKWAGGRLPSEAEWEKAARWDEKKQHPNVRPWGDGYRWDLKYNPKKGNVPVSPNGNPAQGGRGYITNPVDSYPEEASPYGCMDMNGNAYEWCADYYKLYSDDKPATSGLRCMRGGSWPDNYGSDWDRCAVRAGVVPSASWCYSGFRLAK